MIEEITEEWMKRKGACTESFDWIKTQKDRNVLSVAKKLYSEKKQNWCVWLLYRTTNSTKIALIMLWMLFLVLSVCSFLLLESGSYIIGGAVFVASVVAGVVVVVVAGANAFVGVIGKLVCEMGIKELERKNKQR